MKKKIVAVIEPPTGRYGNVVRDLVYGCWCKGKRIAGAEFPNLTLLQLYTIISTHTGCIYLDCPQERITPEALSEILKEKGITHIVISTSSMSFSEDLALLKYLKKNNDLQTIIYGSHPTFYSEDCIADPSVDIAIIGEPEQPIDDIFSGKALENIAGIAYEDTQKIHVNPKNIHSSLDDYPIADRSPIVKNAYFNPLVKKIPWTTMITSRGCPQQCTFCTSPVFYGTRYHANSPKRVKKEMEYLKGLGYKEIFFRDENFTFVKKHCLDTCKEIESLGMSFICSSRTDTIDDDIARSLKKAGCHMVRFGVESGSDKVLKAIKKGTNVKSIKQAFSLCRKHGLDTHAHLMVGCPGEDKDTVVETLDLLRSISPKTITCGAFTPLPGTKVYAEFGGNENLSLEDLHDFVSQPKSYCALSSPEVSETVRKIYRSFYMRPSYILKLLSHIDSPDEFRRVLVSGIHVISYSLSKGKSTRSK